MSHVLRFKPKQIFWFTFRFKPKQKILTNVFSLHHSSSLHHHHHHCLLLYSFCVSRLFMHKYLVLGRWKGFDINSFFPILPIIVCAKPFPLGRDCMIQMETKQALKFYLLIFGLVESKSYVSVSYNSCSSSFINIRQDFTIEGYLSILVQRKTVKMYHLSIKRIQNAEVWSLNLFDQ